MPFGRAALDRNRNGLFDEDEGVPNAVVSVNGSVTATGATGLYAFYNQPPGRYKIRLDVQRLSKGLAPASAAENLIGNRLQIPRCLASISPSRRKAWRSSCVRYRDEQLPATGTLRIALLGSLALTGAVSAGAQETVTISVPLAVSFPVTDVSRSTSAAPNVTTVSFSNASLSPGGLSGFSVQPDAAAFTPPSGSSMPASNV